MKRKRGAATQDEGTDQPATTPRKSSRQSSVPDEPSTSSVRRSGRIPKPKTFDDEIINGVDTESPAGLDASVGSKTARSKGPVKNNTPKKSRRPRDSPLLSRNGSEAEAVNGHEEAEEEAGASVSFATPTKPNGSHHSATRSRAGNAADRSARRKSARKLIEQQQGSDDEDGDALAREILNSSGDDDGADATIGLDLPLDAPSGVEDTPTKRKGGRPKGSRNKRTPTPPRHLPPYEHYFFQNRTSAAKTSNNTLSSKSLLTHEDYYSTMRRFKDPHREELEFLQELHERSFDQWVFEMENGYSLCLHGWGSKKRLMTSFTDYLYDRTDDPPTILCVNGYDAFLTLRDVLNVLATTIPALANQKLGAQPADVLNTILSTLDASPPSKPFVLVIRSFDSTQLRRTSSQAIFARLASSAHFRLVVSCDTSNFGLLWDSNLRAQFNFVFHDATTFQSFDQEIANNGSRGGVVDEVLQLLGRSGRRVQGKEGVVFVLRSLTDSARRLFTLLLSEVLSLEVDETNQNGGDDEFEDAVNDNKPKSDERSGPLGGMEYRTLYRKAVQQLITGNEISFGQLLKEFYDHQMVVSRRDGAGTEILSVPFRREECEAILDDLVVDA